MTLNMMKLALLYVNPRVSKTENMKLIGQVTVLLAESQSKHFIFLCQNAQL
jgi:hypothetical protein